VIVEYGDLACPACRRASETTVPDMIVRYVRTGRAKLVFRPIAFINPSLERGALAAEAAAKQDAMWSLVGLLDRNQGEESSDWLTDEFLERAVTVLGLDLRAWRRDYASSEIRGLFDERAGAGRADGVEVTPTFVIRGPRGRIVIEGVADAREIDAAIARAGPG